MTHHEINFSPFATNVLDAIDRTDLVTPEGTPVRIRQSSSCCFVIDIGPAHYETRDNLVASCILNTNQVGVTQ